MQVGILGSGAGSWEHFARAGHSIVFSYARSQQKLEQLAREAGSNARVGTPREASLDADVLLLAVHWLRFDDVLEQAGDLSGKVIVTCSLPMNEENTELVLGRTSSAAEELAKKLPGARIVSALNTIPSEVLFDVHRAKHETRRPILVYCGDDAPAKEFAAQLIRDTGFEPRDVGPLRISASIG